MNPEPLPPFTLFALNLRAPKFGEPSAASAAFPLGDGWQLLITLRAEPGSSVTQLHAVTLQFFADDEAILKALNAAADIAVNAPAPPVVFRYRWMRDIKQHYENSLREWLAGSDVAEGFYSIPAAKQIFGGRPASERKDRGPIFYSEIARRYVDLGNDIQALAAQEFVSYGAAKEWIRRASDLDLLTKPGKGRRGGRLLTDKAREILAQATREHVEQKPTEGLHE